MNDFTPEKWLWTDADFDQMGWHDVVIHAVAFDSHTLSFDIDYMFRWVAPVPGEFHYKFWLSPATWVFDNVRDVKIDLEPHGSSIIMRVTRSEPVITDTMLTWHWLLDCLDGDISFRASGYRQFTRRAPVLASRQSFSGAQRGGVSFERVTPEPTAA